MITTSTKRRQFSGRNSRRGAALVEFAVVAPLLMMVLVGTIEFGRAMLIQNSVTSAAREAAREATLPSSTDQSVKDTALVYTTQVSDKDVVISISPSLNSVEAGDLITVTVSVPAKTISPMGGRWLGNDYQVSAIAAMRREGYE